MEKIKNIRRNNLLNDIHDSFRDLGADSITWGNGDRNLRLSQGLNIILSF